MVLLAQDHCKLKYTRLRCNQYCIFDGQRKEHIHSIINLLLFIECNGRLKRFFSKYNSIYSLQRLHIKDNSIRQIELTSVHSFRRRDRESEQVAHILWFVLPALFLRLASSGLDTTWTGAYGAISKVRLIWIDCSCRCKKIILEISFGLHRVLPSWAALKIFAGKVFVRLRLAYVTSDVFLNLNWTKRVKIFSIV